MSEFYMIFARKINKMPEFYTIFARKNSFCPNLRGNCPPCPLAPPPVSYACGCYNLAQGVYPCSSVTMQCSTLYQNREVNVRSIAVCSGLLSIMLGNVTVRLCVVGISSYFRHCVVLSFCLSVCVCV